MTYLKQFGLNNFRAIGDQTDFDLSPITILTGPNNAGKSTLIRSVKLLIESIEQSQLLYLLKRGTDTNYQSYDCLLNDSLKGKLLHFNFSVNDSFKIQLTYQKFKSLGLLNKLIASNGENIIFEITIDSTEEHRFRTFIHDISFFSPEMEEIINEQILSNEVINDYFQENKKNKSGFIKNCSKRIQNAINDFDIPFDFTNSTLTELIKYSKFMFEEFNSKERSDDNDPENKFNELEQFCFDKIYIKLFNSIENRLINFLNIFTASFNKNTFFVPVTRQEPKREYNRNDNTLLSDILFSYFDDGLHIKDKPFSKEKVVFRAKSSLSNSPYFVFADKVIKDIYGIGKRIIIKQNAENGNLILNLVKEKSVENIADLGFGLYQLITILITIDYAIVRSNKNNSIIYSINEHDEGSTTILIEEPEISLHPNFQSLLADVFICAYKQYGVRFIIETHSEYLIQKLQLLIAKKESNIVSEDVLIYYFRPKTKNQPPDKIKIAQDGRLTKDFGEGFIDHSAKIIFELWKERGLN